MGSIQGTSTIDEPDVSTLITAPKNQYCSRNPSHFKQLLLAIELVRLSKTQKLTLRYRLEPLFITYSNRAFRYAVAFHLLRFVMTVGSLIVPALLSIQYNNTTLQNIDIQVYWSVWILSLWVTISNGILQYMKIDKKYYTLHSIFHLMVSEGWRFVHLTGRYDGTKFDPPIEPTHVEMFSSFCDQIEKIHMRHVEEEYYKVDEKEKKPIPNQQLTSAEGFLAKAAAPIAPSQREERFISEIERLQQVRVELLQRLHAYENSQEQVNGSGRTTPQTTIVQQNTETAPPAPPGASAPRLPEESTRSRLPSEESPTRSGLDERP